MDKEEIGFVFGFVRELVRVVGLLACEWDVGRSKLLFMYLRYKEMTEEFYMFCGCGRTM